MEGGTKARRGEDPERSFQWYTPKKRRATIYEDVTVDTQPSVHRYIQSGRGWPVHFEDGRGLWSEDSTRLRAGDWYAFRDPGQMWERPYYQAGTANEQLIEGAVRTARRERVFADFTPEWVEFLRKHLQVPAFLDHGIWLALASAARDTLSDTVTHCVALEAAMKQRQAQAYLLYGMDLEQDFGEFPVERSRESFLHDDVWQPARSYVERLRATPDWGERVFAANLCFEPTVGLLIRRELLMRSVRFNGDIVTQALSHCRPARMGVGVRLDGRADEVRAGGCRARRREPRGGRRVAGGLAAARRSGRARAAARVRRAAGRHLVRRRARERAHRPRRALRAVRRDGVAATAGGAG